MSPFIASAAVALVAALAAGPVARVAGLGPRASLRGTGGRRGAEVLRVFAALAALTLVVGGSNGDVIVAAALGAAALGRRAPGAGLAVIFVAAVPALRAGSSVMDDVAGVHVVLGPAVLSPSLGVAVAASLAGVAALATASALVRSPPRGGVRAVVRPPGALADVLVPVVVVLFGVVALAGPPFATGESASWAGVRLGVAALGLVAAAVGHRLTGGFPTGLRGAAGPVAAALAVAVALVAS